MARNSLKSRNAIRISSALLASFLILQMPLVLLAEGDGQPAFGETSPTASPISGEGDTPGPSTPSLTTGAPAFSSEQGLVAAVANTPTSFGFFASLAMGETPTFGQTGALAGGIIGTIFGGVLGGIFGGLAGGFLGSQFDEPDTQAQIDLATQQAQEALDAANAQAEADAAAAAAAAQSEAAAQSQAEEAGGIPGGTTGSDTSGTEGTSPAGEDGGQAP